jgi:hypothetical protein
MKRGIMARVADAIVSYMFPNKKPKDFGGKLQEQAGTRTGNAL